jgi:hypothetical protein
MAKGFSGTIVVDVRCPRNRDLEFVPLSRTLRGEKVIGQESTDRPSGILAQLGSIPGDRVTVDFAKKKYTVRHRLGLSENKTLAATVRKFAATPQGGNQQNINFSVPDELGRGDEDGDILESDVPTWLYWLYRNIQAGCMHIVTGTLPTEAEIRDMGPIRTGEQHGLTAKKDNEAGIKSLGWMHPPAKEDREPALAGAGK